MVFGWFLWFFKVVSWFSWFFMVPGWFFMVFFPECTRPKLYPGLTIQSRSAARRAAWDLVIVMINTVCGCCVVNISANISFLVKLGQALH